MQYQEIINSDPEEKDEVFSSKELIDYFYSGFIRRLFPHYQNSRDFIR
jgi:hypothetical protein